MGEKQRIPICSNLSSFLVKVLQEKVSVLILNATLMHSEPPPGFLNTVPMYQHCSIACIQAHSFSVFVIITCLTAPVPMLTLPGPLNHSSLSPPTIIPYEIPLGHHLSKRWWHQHSLNFLSLFNYQNRLEKTWWAVFAVQAWEPDFGSLALT